MIVRILVLFFLSFNLNAADWLTLQGTQKKEGHKPWGFFQFRVEENSGDILIKNGINKTPFSYIKPNLQHQRDYKLFRARVGLRGAFDYNKINYALLAELGQNGITQPIDYYQHNYLVDASVTLRYLPVNIRIGRFKYGGSEEGLMARFTSPFINFSTLSDQLMLERFIETDKSMNTINNIYTSEPSSGVGAYRDSGISMFKTFSVAKNSNITLSYMLGNGSGLNNYNVNGDNYTHYFYGAFERKLGDGKGYRQESYKLYTWYQNGKRELDSNGESHLYDRIRYGLGGTYFYNGLRVEAEYMRGNGMIFTGAKDVNSDEDEATWNYQIQASDENKADGYYLSSTYALFKELEIIARYDVYNRMTNLPKEHRIFKTFTGGFSYIIKSYDRIDVNYAIKEAEAPQNQAAQNILDSMGNLLSIQYTIVFK